MQQFYDELDALYSTGDREAIEKYILGAIAETDENSPERAALYNELAGHYRGVSSFARSADAFAKSMEIFEANGMGATPEYATVLLNLAGLHRIQGEAEKAIALFHDAKQKLENAGAQTGYAYVSILNNLALAHQEKGDYPLALELATTALERLRAENESGNEHEIAASLNNLAAINISLKNYAEADTRITEALAVYEAMPEPDVHLAAALTTKAVILCRSGQYRDALEGFAKSLELTRRFFGENIEYAICKRNMADVYELLGDGEAARNARKEAAAIIEKQ